MFIRDINENSFPFEINYDTYMMNGWFIVSYSKKIMYNGKITKYHFLKEKYLINNENNVDDILNLIVGKDMKKHCLKKFNKEIIKDFGL